MIWLYTVVYTLGLAVLAPAWALEALLGRRSWQALRRRAWPQVPPVAAGGVWIHAVSVGEATAAVPLVQRLKQRFPDRPVIVSTTTETGQRVARQRIAADAFLYFPLDWPWAIRQALRRLRPAAVVLLEGELWPNFLRTAKREGVPVLLASARISERSFRRYQRLRPWMPQWLGQLRWLLAQTEADAERLRQLGAPPERVVVVGNLKFDIPRPDPPPLARWLETQLAAPPRRPLLVAGSVVAGEEESVLEAFARVRQRHEQALLLLAPRRPERFEPAARLAAERGWRIVRRSQLRLDAPLEVSVAVVVLDSLGELAGLYALADAVFVGGSLVPAGGHNLLEPAQWGKVPVFGPYVTNFQAIAQALQQAGAARVVRDAETLAQAWLELVEDPEKRSQRGARAAAFVAAHRGAADRVLDYLGRVLDETP